MASLGTIAKGQVGATLEIVMQDEDGDALTLSDFSTLQMRFWKPTSNGGVGNASSGTVVVKTASDGGSGKLQYVTEDSFLDTYGTWAVMGYVENGAGTSKLSSDVISMSVENIIPSS